MTKITQNLYITYSNQRARDLKAHTIANPFDKVITLDSLILEIFESSNFQLIIDDAIATAILYKIIQDNNIEYFTYLDNDAVSLTTIYDFIMKCKRNSVKFDTLLYGEKLKAIEEIDDSYQVYKEVNDLADISDIEKIVSANWDDRFKYNFDNIFIDNFRVGNISFIKSKMQEQILEKLSSCSMITQHLKDTIKAKIIKPSNNVFDNIDEVKTSLKIARKLLEEGESSDEILIVASDIAEYAPLYKLFLDEYELQGYSSLGTPLSAFHNTSVPKVERVLDQYRLKVQSLEVIYSRLGLTLSEARKESIKASLKVLDEKKGIELTEPNQLVGLKKTYRHIIFIGTDINHFPPAANDTFLYSYEDDLKFFYANNYFTSSQTQLDELKRLSENLYIITASYSDKRELTPSILLDGKFDGIIDVDSIKSVNEMALDKKTVMPENNTKAYYESILSEVLTKFDGSGVKEVSATHLSASQINKYLSCPLAYLYSNKVKIKAPKQTDEGFDVMQQGSLMHMCFELFGKNIKETQNRSTDKEELYALMHEISIEAYFNEDTTKERGDENIHHQIFLSTLQAGLMDERDGGLLVKFVDYYIESAEEFEYFQNSEFEKGFALDDKLKPYEIKDDKDGNYFIRGFIDRFDNLENRINVIDYKSKKIGTRSGKDKETQEKIDELKDIQLALYILYAKQKYPGKEYYSAMLSFKGESKVSHFGELFHDDFNEEYGSKLKDIIYDTKKGIENGNFGFDNTDEKTCEWCDFRFICHESVLKKNKNLFGEKF